MITLPEFLAMVEYSITDGFEFLWLCYGPHAHSISGCEYDPENPDSSVSCVFDKITQQVYEIQAWDGTNNIEYRWIDPDFRQAYLVEAASRGIDASISADGRKYIDLETENDITEKAKAIFNRESYDRRVEVPVSLSDEDAFTLMRMAHEKDITLNELINDILREIIKGKINE